MSFPELRTDRLELRRISAADQTLIFTAMSHPEVTAFYGCRYETLSETQSLMAWFEVIVNHGTGIWWGICLKDAPDQLIGACGFHDWDRENHSAEIGFWLLPAYWQQGMMQEGLRTLLPFCFSELAIHRLQAYVEVGNTSSQKLLLKLGFQPEGVLRGARLKEQLYSDLLLYGRLAMDGGD